MRSEFFGCPTAQDGSKLDRGIIFFLHQKHLITIFALESRPRKLKAHIHGKTRRMAANCQISKNGETNARESGVWKTSSLHVQFALAAHWLNACNSTGSLSAYSDITRTRAHARPSISPSLFLLPFSARSLSFYRAENTLLPLMVYFSNFYNTLADTDDFYVSAAIPVLWLCANDWTELYDIFMRWVIISKMISLSYCPMAYLLLFYEMLTVFFVDDDFFN